MASHHGTNPEYFSLPATDLDTFVESRIRDSRSGLPLGACSLLLRYLLPQLEVERYAMYRRTSIENAQKTINTGLYGSYCHAHVTGSSIEGLSVPPYRERTPVGAPGETPGRAGAPFYQASDVDIMMEVRFLPLEVRPTPGRLYMDESRASHVGYVRLVLDDPTDTYGLSFSVRNICRPVEEGGQTIHYLSNDALKGPLAKLAEDNAEHTDGKVNLSGPAVNLEPKHSGQQGMDQIPDIDIVTALPLLGHPPAFHHWLERVSRRNTHWPRRETVKDIRRHGRCFVVTTGHPSSADRDLECRLSFSDPELRLAQTVTPVQRKVYLLVKLLQKCYLKEPKVVVTYHLKTLMFWLLEGSQPRDWTEKTIFERVLRFLDKIETCLERREIPSYFYPSNNLISHADPKHVDATLATVRRIRDDPLRHLYGIDERVWMGFSTLAPLSSLHRPVLEVMRGGDKVDIRLKMAGSLLRQARQGAMRDILWPLRCADLLRDTYGILRDVLPLYLGDETPGTEGFVLWSSSDWLALATVAVFAALRQEESCWVLDVSGSFKLPREGSYSGDGDPFMEVAALLLPARPHVSLLLRMFLAVDCKGKAPLDPMITLKYAKMVRLEKLQTAEKQAAILANVARFSLQDSKTEDQQAASGAEHVQETSTVDRCEKARPRPTAAADKVKNVSTGAVSCPRLGGARPKDTTQGVVRSATFAPPAPDLPRLMTETVTPIADAQAAAVAAASSHVAAPPPYLEPAPERLAASQLFRETYGSCPALVSRLHLPILDIIGYLRRRRPHLACRCAFWLHQLTCLFGGWRSEVAPSVPLSAAALFLASLPPTSAALLGRPAARAALLPLSAFVIYTALLGDEPFRRQVAQMEVGEAKLALFDYELQFGDAEHCAYDDVVWTNVAMKLCAREMMGQDVRACLREVGLVSGGDKGQRARQILMRHHL